MDTTDSSTIYDNIHELIKRAREITAVKQNRVNDQNRIMRIMWTRLTYERAEGQHTQHRLQDEAVALREIAEDSISCRGDAAVGRNTVISEFSERKHPLCDQHYGENPSLFGK